MHVGGKLETVRAALSCIACDVPAARKLGGFIGHRVFKMSQGVSNYLTLCIACFCIAKRCFSIWVCNGIIKKEHYISIQSGVDSFKCPPDVGCIPYKLGSKFSGLKAHQWKNWTLYFSLYALKSILPHRDFGCSLLKHVPKFVIEKYLSSLVVINDLIEKFCTSFLGLYGQTCI